MSRSIDDLVPEVAAKCRSLLAACAREGLLLKITHTLRTYSEQDAIYTQGRTTPGEPCRHTGDQRPRVVGSCPTHPLGLRVTNARAGHSWHNFGRALDVAEADGSPYDLGDPGLEDDHDLWEKIGAIGEACGLEWGGYWKRPDRPHFEDRGGTTLAALRAAHESDGLA